MINFRTLYKQRKLYGRGDEVYLRFIEDRWGTSLGEPNNLLLNPNIIKAGEALIIGSQDEGHHLNFGWYHLDHDIRGNIPFRWSAYIASILIKAVDYRKLIVLKYMPSNGIEQLRVIIRSYMDHKEISSFLLDGTDRPFEWHDNHIEVSLAKGEYEIIIRAEKADGFKEKYNAAIGIALSSLKLE
jgi:hypothetical protein